MHVAHAPEKGGCHEPGKVAGDTAANRDDHRVAVELTSQQLISDRAPTLSRLVPLSGRECEELSIRVGRDGRMNALTIEGSNV